MIVTPSRGRMKAKRAVDQSSALTLASEYVLKKLIQHSWPARTKESPWECQSSVQFVPLAGRSLGEDFWDAFDIALRIVSREHAVDLYRQGDRLLLYGVYFVNDYGKIRPVVKPPF